MWERDFRDVGVTFYYQILCGSACATLIFLYVVLVPLLQARPETGFDIRYQSN